MAEQVSVADQAGWFGLRLRELRECNGISREELATRAAIPLRTIADWESRRGADGVIWRRVIAVSLALGVTPDAFLLPPKELPPPKRGRPKTKQKSE